MFHISALEQEKTVLLMGSGKMVCVCVCVCEILLIKTKKHATVVRFEIMAQVFILISLILIIIINIIILIILIRHSPPLGIQHSLSIIHHLHPSIHPVKINSTCTRCDCIVTQHLLLSGQLSQSLDPRALQNVILYTSGITILYIHMYFNTVPQIVEEQHCFQTLWKYNDTLLKSIVHQFKLSSKITLKALFCSRDCWSLNCILYKRFVHCPALHCCSSS